MSLTPLTFTGVSTFSSDFQTILKRAVSIASLPMTSLQNQQKDLLQQKLLLSNLSASVGALSTSVSTLGSVGKNKALGASSSNTAKVAVTSVNTENPASYTIANITSVAKAAAETSIAGYADTTSAAVSTTGIVKLTKGASQYTIDISGSNTLTGLRNAINALGAGVTASILTTGNGATPYYLSITANSTGATTLELRDDPTGANTSLITAANQGANTVFELNGVAVIKPTSLINDVVPGISFQVLATTAANEQATLTIAPDRSKLSNALSQFATAYNDAREQVNAQVGSGAGLLSGDFLVRDIQSRLRSVASFTGAASIKGLADLGIEFDNNGVASFRSSAITTLSDTQLADAFEFLGNATTGFGTLATSLNAVSNSVTGMAKIQLDKYEETDKRLTEQIAAITERVNNLQLTLTAKLQAADSLLASLQSQQSMLDASLKSLSFSVYGKQSS